VRFKTPSALQEALDTLGGGIRGKFRIDRRHFVVAGAAKDPGPHADQQAAARPGILTSSASAARPATPEPDGWHTVGRRPAIPPTTGAPAAQGYKDPWQ